MSAKPDLSGIGRRRFLARAAGGLGAMLLSGCDRLSSNPQVSRILDSAERLSELVQRLIAGRAALAREYSEADISPHFKSNGTSDPDDEDYQALARNGFADWRLEIGGLVERPAKLSLEELRALPSRS